MTGVANLCCILSCPNRLASNINIKKHSLFRFPKELGRCSIWLKFCDREDLKNLSPELLHKKNYRVCSLHFSEEMFAGVRLKKTAFPTVFRSREDSLNGSRSDMAKLQQETLNDPVLADENYLREAIESCLDAPLPALDDIYYMATSPEEILSSLSLTEHSGNTSLETNYGLDTNGLLLGQYDGFESLVNDYGVPCSGAQDENEHFPSPVATTIVISRAQKVYRDASTQTMELCLEDYL